MGSLPKWQANGSLATTIVSMITGASLYVVLVGIIASIILSLDHSGGLYKEDRLPACILGVRFSLVSRPLLHRHCRRQAEERPPASTLSRSKNVGRCVL